MKNKGIEIGFLCLLGLYSIAYERDTLTDFIVCSALSFLLLLFANRMNLPSPKLTPYGRKDKILVVLTIALFVAAWMYGFWAGKVNAISAPKSLVVTLVYFYYAWIQHFLVQRYLAVRIHQYYVSKGWDNTASNAALTVGLGFAILHIPYPHLLLPSFLGGLVFVYYYLTTGRLWAVVITHALIASASLFWYLDDNPFTELHMIIPYLAEEGLQ